MARVKSVAVSLELGLGRVCEGRTSVVAFECNKRVHGTNFGDVVLRAVQPQVLNVTLLGSSLLCGDASCVVCAQFVRANTYKRI